MDLVSGNLGPEAKYAVDIVGRNLVAKLEYSGVQLHSSHSLELDLVAVLEIVKAKIPGSIDDAIINIVEAALNASSGA